MEPNTGDYVKLDGENFTTVDYWMFDFQSGMFTITDTDGEQFLVIRNKSFDTDLINGWEAIR